MNDLKLNHDRGTLKRILENAVPQTLQDVVVIYVAVTGKQDGELREENYVNKVYPQMIAGRLWSAIQVTTASGICAVVDLVMNGGGRHDGFVRQEDFRLQDVLQNRFGKHYAAGGGKEISAHIVVSGQAGHQRAAPSLRFIHARHFFSSGSRRAQLRRLVAGRRLVEGHHGPGHRIDQSGDRRAARPRAQRDRGGLRARHRFARARRSSNGAWCRRRSAAKSCA